MNRTEWTRLYHDVRTPVSGINLFPSDQRADIALEIARAERKERRKLAETWNNH